MNRLSMSLIAVAGSVIAGCATTAPSPDVDLGFEPPEQWTGLESATGVAPQASEDPWWTTLGDESLAAIVAEALEHNHDLAAAAARVESAAARARIAGADLAPQVSTSINSSRRRQNFIGLPIPTGPGGGSDVLSSTSTSHGVALNLSWEADLWGRIRSGKKAALEDFDAARIDLEAARLSLAGQTAKAWLGAAEAAEQLRLAEATLENREASAERVDRRYRAGLRSALDLRLARSNEAVARAALEARTLQVDSSLRQLETLLGRYPRAALEGATALPDIVLQPAPVGIPADVLSRRPDLAALERRLVAAGLRVAEARAGLYPRISLTASAGRSSESLSDLLDNDFSVWSLAANLVQPLFSGGRLRAGVDLAEAGFDELTSTLASNLLRAFAEVETTLVAERSVAAQVEALAVATEEARAARQQAEDRYNSGLVDFLTVLESQRQALEAESRWIEARRERLVRRIDLHLALGGGFQSSFDLTDQKTTDQKTTDETPPLGSADADPASSRSSNSASPVSSSSNSRSSLPLGA